MATTYEFNRDAASQGAQAFNNGVEQAKQGAQHVADQVRTQSEQAMQQGQAAFAQAGDRTREVMDRGMKAFDEMNTQARGSTDSMMAASRAASQGLEAMVQQASEFTRHGFEQATTAMREIAAAKTPADVFAAQNAYMKAAFDTMVQGYSRLTETVMKVTSDVVQPLSNQMSEATQKATSGVKSMMGAMPTGFGGQR